MQAQKYLKNKNSKQSQITKLRESNAFISIFHIISLTKTQLNFIMITKLFPNAFRALSISFYFATHKPNNNKNISLRKPQTNPLGFAAPTRVKEMEVYESQADVELAESITKLTLRQFSIKVHNLVREKEKSPVVWSTIQRQLQERMIPTSDPIVIRSYSKILYSLSKSKKATGNYETKVSLVLPFATPQSFTTLITALSRVAPYSQEFGYIVEMLYYKRKAEFNARELVAINYSLANNGRKCDNAIIDHIDSFNAVETVTMLRSYDKSELLTPKLLDTILVKLKSVQREFNVLDLADILCIYLKHRHTPPHFETMVQQSYAVLKRHVNDVCFQKIWEYLPRSVNEGRLKAALVEDMMGTLEILRKGRNMSEVIWKRIQPTFQQFQNLELRLRLERLY